MATDWSDSHHLQLWICFQILENAKQDQMYDRCYSVYDADYFDTDFSSLYITRDHFDK